MGMSAQDEDGSCSGQREEELPRAGALVQRFGLFQGGRGCQLEVDPVSAALCCRCGACEAWAAYVAGRLPGGPAHPQYEVLTQELVDALARYIWQRAALALEASRPGPFRVLEVGAGDGRLSHHLRRGLGALRGGQANGATSVPHPHLELMCTDSGANRLHLASPFRQEVRLQAVGRALEEHRPHLVLASWMPLGDDWTGAFRASPSLLEYLLIGEPDSDMCGDAEATWGIGFDGGVGFDRECCHDAPDESPPTALSVPGESRDGEVRECLCTEGHSALPQLPPHPHQPAAAAAAQAGLVEEGVRPKVCVCDRKGEGRPLYAREGFSRHDLPLVEVQLCRMDARWQAQGRSKTVAFRRSL